MWRLHSAENPCWMRSVGSDPSFRSMAQEGKKKKRDELGACEENLAGGEGRRGRAELMEERYLQPGNGWRERERISLRPPGINFEYQTLDLEPFLRQPVMFLWKLYSEKNFSDALKQRKAKQMTLSCFALCHTRWYSFAVLADSLTHRGRQPLIIKSVCKCAQIALHIHPWLWAAAARGCKSQVPTSTHLLPASPASFRN